MKRASKITSALGLSMAVALLAAEPADARRGGSFGSRGARTYQAPPPTRTAPDQAQPIQRSMTQSPAAAQSRPAAAPATAAAQAPRRGGLLGGIGGGLLGGLLAGGLIGMLLGHGWGGMGAGLLTALIQVAVIGLAIFLLMRLFRRRSAAPAHAGASAAGYAPHKPGFGFGGGAPQGAGGFQPREAAPEPAYAPQPADIEEIGLVQSDRDAFERLLGEVQDAFGREDYASLRARTTPEIMSYLSEELAQNATQGRRNEVTATRLLQADIAEAWREGDADYATAAMRYESVDIMRDRNSGAVLSGDPARATETTEMWTFVRRGGGDWKLSAIQEA